MNYKLTAYEAILRSAKLYPNENALYFKGKFIMFFKFIKKINQYAYKLKELGIKRNDVITLCLPNIPQAIYLLYAINQIGAIGNLIHPLMNATNLKLVMNKVNSKILFCLDTSYDNFKDFNNDNILVIPCIVSDELSIFLKLGYKLLNKNKLKNIKQAKITSSDFNIKSELKEFDNDYLKDSYYLQSGGTSGNTKTIAISNFALNALTDQFNVLLELKNGVGKYMLAVLPFFHAYGLAMGIHVCIYHGGCDILMPKFSSNEVCRLIKKGYMSFMIGIPILYEALLRNKKFDNKGLKDLYICFVGGDFVSSSLRNKFNDLMIKHNSKARLYEGYGLTETTGVCAVNTNLYHKDNSVGKILTNVKMKILDQNKNDLGFNKLGEIYITGETIMNHYLNDEKNSFYIDKDNIKWVETGDFGYIDEENFLFYKQRIKNIVKVKGINVFPSDIEEALKKYDFIFDCAAIGVEDKEFGHRVKLFIVLDRNHKDHKDVNEIKQIIDKYCGRYALPKEIIYIDKLPKTSIGKIDINALNKY